MQNIYFLKAMVFIRGSQAWKTEMREGGKSSNPKLLVFFIFLIIIIIFYHHGHCNQYIFIQHSILILLTYIVVIFQIIGIMKKPASTLHYRWQNLLRTWVKFHTWLEQDDDSGDPG